MWPYPSGSQWISHDMLSVCSADVGGDLTAVRWERVKSEHKAELKNPGGLIDRANNDIDI